MQEEKAKPNIAVVSFDSLGDSLIYLMMAENFRRNGFRVTYYGDLVAQMKDWLPQLTINTYPTINEMDTKLAGFDVVLCSPPSFIRTSFSQTELQKLAHKYILICQKAPCDWYVDHTERIKQTVKPELIEKLLPLAVCSRRIRYKTFSHQSAVQIALDYLKEEMRLDPVGPKIDLRPPAHLKFRKNTRRIIISPDSAGPQKKNWSPRRFFALAEKLRDKGYDPHIVVAPRHHAVWRKMSQNVYQTPKFSRIGDLAAYIYESGALVANDSGNGHLASLLNVPTVTIYRKRNPRFTWRPGWGPGVVVCPFINISINPLNLRFWRPFISTRVILRHIERMCG